MQGSPEGGDRLRDEENSMMVERLIRVKFALF